MKRTPTNEELAVRTLLRAIGEDPDREGLRDTPRRFLEFLRVATNANTIGTPFKMTTFEGERYDQMIVQQGIPFYSLCEHHIVPFFGTAVVAYVPGEDGRIVGLSKLARTIRWAARGLQTQERITTEAHAYLTKKLAPAGCAVILRARHLCMEMRGVEVHDTHTTTSALSGVFMNEQATREELYSIINLSKS